MMSMFLLKIQKYISFMKEFSDMQDLVVRVRPVLEYIKLSDERYSSHERRIETMETEHKEMASALATIQGRLDIKPSGRRTSIAPVREG